MAMIDCPECGQRISEKAKKCVHCGKIFIAAGDMTKQIKCTECGVSYSATEEMCPNCGCPAEKRKMNKSKMKKVGIVIACMVLIIIIGCSIFTIISNSNPVNKYLNLFKKDDDEAALAVYSEQIEGNAELETELEEEQNREIDDIFQKFKQKTISYDEAVTQIENYLKYAPSKQYATSIKKDIDALNGSRTAYSDAQNAEQSDDIETALKKYKAVIEKDELYTDAQNKIKDIQDSLKKKLLNEAESYVQNKQYKEAIADIDKAISILGSSDDLTELKSQYSDLKANQYAKIVVTDKSVTPQDSSNWIFNNYVNMIFDITNNSDKAITGIEGTLTACDLFGKEIVTMGCDFTGHTIQPGETCTISELSYKCNEFVEEDMELYNTEYKDLQFTYDISMIVYEDGSTINPE